MNYRDVLQLEAPVDGEVEQRFLDKSGELLFVLQRLKMVCKDLDNIKKYVYYKKGDKEGEQFNETDGKHLHVLENNRVRLFHGLIGIMGEAGELAEAGQNILMGKGDETNILEELGDNRWFTELVLDVLGSTMQEVEDKNNRKLRTRYGDRFTEEAYSNRNLEAEREQLES